MLRALQQNVHGSERFSSGFAFLHKFFRIQIVGIHKAGKQHAHENAALNPPFPRGFKSGQGTLESPLRVEMRCNRPTLFILPMRVASPAESPTVPPSTNRVMT